MMITQVSDSLYSKLVHEIEGAALPTTSPSLRLFRERAFERFKAHGFPTVKNEDWKYTNMQSLLSKDYARPDYTDTLRYSSEQFDAFGIPSLDAYRVVLVDGQFRAELSQLPEGEGVHVGALEAALEDERVLTHLGAYADKTNNPFVALNSASFEVGLFISVSRSVVLDKPIHVIRVSTCTEATFSQSRNLYVLGAYAEAEIVESLVAFDGVQSNLCLNVTEVALEEQAKLQHYTVQSAHPEVQYVSHTEVHQRKHSLYNNYNANFRGASFVRNDINVRMDDPEVESHLYGIVLINGNQFVDNHTIVDHLHPHGESYEWYKTIAQGASTAIFNGKIFVRQDAQKTNAFQQNNNILIGEQATVNSKPQLEIFADDVKCSHGCTMGQFDDEALFYLRSRGIREDKARVLLVQAFAYDVTNRFENDVVRTYVESLIERDLE